MLELLNDPLRRQTMGRAAATAGKDFCWDKTAHRVTEIMMCLCEAGAGR